MKHLKKTTYIDSVKKNRTSIFSFLNLSFIQGSNALIQILIVPIITRAIGLTGFGPVALAGSYAALVSIFINYGSNQSGIKDVAIYVNDNRSLSETFYTIYITRLFFFILSFLLLLIVLLSDLPHKTYFLFANAIILSETLNPLFFFVGIQKLFLYNIVNLVAKVISATLIIVLITSPSDGEWVNFWLGIPGLAGNLFLCAYLVKRHRLYHYKVPFGTIWEYIKQNFYLTGNNLSVQLQQSFFLFAVSATSNALVLGAYSLCDKVVWSFRLLIISIFNAVYPKSVSLFTQKPELWLRFRKQLNTLLLIVFLVIAGLLVLFAGLIVDIVTKEHHPLAVDYIRAICLVPLVAALNSINVIDLLMRNRYRYIFIVALILLAISVFASNLFIRFGSVDMYGYYPIIVEVFSLPLYWYFIHRAKQQGIRGQ